MSPKKGSYTKDSNGKSADKKNPTNVKIGQRIKQARKMAGFNTAAQLLNEIPDWGTGRLGNYEAGISQPSPEDISLIAAITDSSPCWIMFGAGPIRATGRDLQAIRHQNFCNIIESKQEIKGAFNKLLKAAGLSKHKAQEHIDNPFLKISDQICRKCEKQLKLPTKWMDEQHVESDPLCIAFPDDMRRIMEIYSSLEENNRSKLLEIAEVFKTNN